MLKNIKQYYVKATEKTPLYVYVNFSAKTALRLEHFVESLKIPNPMVADKFHTTILYSKTPFSGYEDLGGLDEPIKVDPSTYQYELFGKDKQSLVIAYECPFLKKRFDYGMALGASFDYPKYVPHVTLSYACGPEISDLVQNDKLPLPKFPLFITAEHSEPLDDNWTDKVLKKD